MSSRLRKSLTGGRFAENILHRAATWPATHRSYWDWCCSAPLRCSPASGVSSSMSRPQRLSRHLRARRRARRLPLGSDPQGRNLLAVMIEGTWLTVRTGVIAGALGIALGGALGFVSAYFRRLSRQDHHVVRRRSPHSTGHPVPRDDLRRSADRTVLGRHGAHHRGAGLAQTRPGRFAARCW